MSDQSDPRALVRPQRPWEMTPTERVAEMGELLAVAFLRYRRHQLADQPRAEDSCDQTVHTKEVA